MQKLKQERTDAAPENPNPTPQNRTPTNLNSGSRSIFNTNSPPAPRVLDLRSQAASPTRANGFGRPPFTRPPGNRGPRVDSRATGRPPGASNRGPRSSGPGARGTARRRNYKPDTATDEKDFDPRDPPKSKLQIEYEEEKLREKNKPKIATIEDPSPENLLGYGPKVSFGGGFGDAAAVENALSRMTVTDYGATDATRTVDLARQLLSGGHVYLRSEGEKEAVLLEASERAKMLAEKKTEESGSLVEAGEVEFEGVGEEAREVFWGRVLEGQYEPLVDEGKSGVAREILRMVRRNGTYLAKDEQALMERLGPMLPAP